MQDGLLSDPTGVAFINLAVAATESNFSILESLFLLKDNPELSNMDPPPPIYFW